jgi:hypothetical protein
MVKHFIFTATSGFCQWITSTKRIKMISFFDYHRWFLSTDHKYRKNKNDFFVGRVERNVAPPLLSGEGLYDVVLEYDDLMFDF